MATQMKNIFLALLTWALITATSSSTWAQDIQWKSDIEAAQTLAEQQNKLVLLHFTAGWCHPCRTLDSFVFTNRQVQRTMAANVIPVKIDVDEFPNLVKEYGVSGVPFDVAITPAGRVVYKRSSPRDASAYNGMIKSYSKTIGALASGNPSLHQQLDELKDVVFTDNQIVQHPEIAPAMQALTGPQPSFQSSELKRREEERHRVKIVNPYAVAAAAQIQATKVEATKVAATKVEATKPKPKPKPIGNDFFVPSSPVSIQKTVTCPETNPAELLKQSLAPVASQPKPIASADATLVMPDQRKRDPNPDALRSAAGKPEGIGSASQSNKLVGNPFSREDLPTKANTNDFVGQDADQTGLAGVRNEAALVGVSQSAEQSHGQDFDKGKASNFGLHGKCPVTLLKEGRWVDGDARFGCVHRRRTYLFSSESTLKEFQADPDAFSPLLAGFDPVLYETTGELVDGDVDHGVFMGKVPNQRVVLFATPKTRAEFQAQPRIYIEKIRQAMKASGGSSSNIMR